MKKAYGEGVRYADYVATHVEYSVFLRIDHDSEHTEKLPALEKNF
jgi:hypothetical protein